MADTRAIASAVSIYAAHMGRLPDSLEVLTKPATNDRGATAGPFLLAVPAPVGETPYRYEIFPDGTFSIVGESHGQTIEAGSAVTAAR
jgi:hypothetical protein